MGLCACWWIRLPDYAYTERVLHPWGPHLFYHQVSWTFQCFLRHFFLHLPYFIRPRLYYRRSTDETYFQYVGRLEQIFKDTWTPHYGFCIWVNCIFVHKLSSSSLTETSVLRIFTIGLYQITLRDVSSLASSYLRLCTHNSLSNYSRRP